MFNSRNSSIISLAFLLLAGGAIVSLLVLRSIEIEPVDNGLTSELPDQVEESEIFYGHLDYYLRRSGCQVWFDPPPDLLGSDDSPRPPSSKLRKTADRSVKAICFWTRPTKSELKGLSYFQGLESLVVTDISDDMLTDLPLLPNLRMLGVYLSDSFSGSGLTSLEKYPKLEQLDFCFAKGLTPTGIANLQLFPQLRSLSIIRSPVNDEIIREIGRCMELTNLELGCWGTPEIVTCTSLEPFSRLGRLEYLETWGINPTVNEVGYLAQLTNLKRVRMHFVAMEAREEIRRVLPIIDFR